MEKNQMSIEKTSQQYEQEALNHKREMKKITIIALPEKIKDLLADPKVHAKIEVIKQLRECSERMFTRPLSLKAAKDIIDSIPCSFILDETRIRMMTRLLDSLGCKWDVVDAGCVVVGNNVVTHFDLDKELMKSDIAYLRTRVNDMAREIHDLDAFRTLNWSCPDKNGNCPGIDYDELERRRLTKINHLCYNGFVGSGK